MQSTNTTQNIQKNKEYYNNRYAKVNIQTIVSKLDNLNSFLLSIS